MRFLLLLVPVFAVCLTSCDVQRAMDRNRCAVQRSTEAIDRNIEALENTTRSLKEMQESS